MGAALLWAGPLEYQQGSPVHRIFAMLIECVLDMEKDS